MCSRNGRLFFYHVPKPVLLRNLLFGKAAKCATPDDHKTQYIDRPYRLGGGGLQNSLRKTIFVICYFGLK